MNKKILYDGQEVYLGIDVHRHKYAVCAVVSGREVDKFIYSGDREGFVHVLVKRYSGAKRVESCYEAGFSGYELHRQLVERGIRNYIVHPGAVGVSSLKRKTDKRDAKQMGYQLFAGTLKGIYIPSKEEEDIRRFIRLRRNLVKDRTRMRIRVRMLFNYYGILRTDYQGVLSYLEARRIYVLNCQKFGGGFKEEVGTYLDNWKIHSNQIDKLASKIKKQSEQSIIDKYYLSVPGIGVLTARTLAVELGDMGRFGNAKHLYSYIGLTPSEFSSGERRRLGRISREGKPSIRAMLIQAAWKAIKEDEYLLKVYMGLKNKKGGKRAIVAVARRLAGIARRCVKDKKMYQMPVLEKTNLAA